MDKLRALQYFVASAEERSFSGAARLLDVSVPSITKLIGALERSLGVRLLDRSTHGLTLTASGEAYYEACAPLLLQLSEIDASLAPARQQVQRTLVVGAPGLLSRLLLVPALARFRSRHPDVQIELRVVDHLTVTDVHTRGLDVLVALGWPGSQNWVQRRLAQSRLLICAHPDYWKRHGVPGRPSELRAHDCLLVRTPEGTVIDLWRHTRGPETEEVAVRGWLISESRDYVAEAAMHGQGVARFADLSIWPLIETGALQAVLTDWISRESPPYSALFRPDARQDPQVQGFVGFLAELLGAVESSCRQVIGERPQSSRPGWHSARRGRVSAAPKQTRR
jgi:LysR family transcriptional regulator for bpeEF and oprC